MKGIRRALLFTSAERYINLVVNFALIALVSRLLSPAEIGVSAVGVTIWALAETLRDVPSSYLVQQKEIAREDVRTAFTVMLLISLGLAGALIVSSDWIAAQYDDPKLAAFLKVFALAFLPGPFERPIMALFRRDLSFGRFALINVTTVLVNAGLTVSLVLLGFSYMSFAWAALGAALTAAVLAIYFRRELWLFRPHLGHWRRAVRFGGYTSLHALIYQILDLVPYLVLSRAFSFDVVGYYNRSQLVSQVPGKLLLSGLVPVVLPALAAEAREGRDLKAPFLTGIAYISAVHWPAFLLLALLAYPAVEIVVGAQWFGIVPLVQILALSMLPTFAGVLIYPALLAHGALRDLLMSNLVTAPILIAVTGVSAMFGLMPLAISFIFTWLLQSAVALTYVRRHVRFRWSEFAAAAGKSAVITLATALPPAAHILASGFSFEMSVPRGIGLGCLAVMSWLIAVWLTRHPLRGEIGLILQALRGKARREKAPLPASPLT